MPLYDWLCHRLPIPTVAIHCSNYSRLDCHEPSLFLFRSDLFHMILILFTLIVVFTLIWLSHRSFCIDAPEREHKYRRFA